MVAVKVVEDYLAALVAHDWDVVRSLVSDDVVRLGPYADNFQGRDEYVGYLAKLMPRLEGYAMELGRVTCVGDGRKAFVELIERVTVNGQATVTGEVLIFDIDESAKISRIEIFIRQL